MYVYYIDGKKFITEYNSVIPWLEIYSPDENTPAYEDLEYGYKCWYQNGKRHRLTGPARMWSAGKKEFWLNDKHYEKVHNWLKDHPNPDLYFDAIGLNETERVLWFLQN
jgi:hypothetical protein